MSLEDFYQAQVRQEITQKLVYPPAARRLGQTGRVYVRFILAQTGQVLSFEVVKASPYPALNHAADELVRVAARFPPMPAELGASSKAFQIPIEYHLDN